MYAAEIACVMWPGPVPAQARNGARLPAALNDGVVIPVPDGIAGKSERVPREPGNDPNGPAPGPGPDPGPGPARPTPQARTPEPGSPESRSPETKCPAQPSNPKTNKYQRPGNA